jgi:hypothetical protein
MYLDASNRMSYVSGSTKWNDLSGNNNSGSLFNGPTYDNANGGSIVFDGVNDYVSVNNNASLNIANNITVECWFNPTSYRTNTYSVNFFQKYSSTSTANFNFYFGGTYVPTQLRVLANRGGVWGTVSPDSGTIPLSQWTHVVWTYANGGRLYINGVSKGNPVGSGDLALNSDVVLIGNELAGNISQAKIYNRALSSTEVLQNYNATKTRFGLQ